MKQLMMLMLMFFSITSCAAGGNNPHPEANQKVQHKADVGKAEVSVIYFHGKQRCITCRSIEKCAKEVVDELGNNRVSMQVIDISDPKNEAIAQKYKVSWSSLFLTKGDKNIDLTKIGFRYAKNDPAAFKKQLKIEINNLLK